MAKAWSREEEAILTEISRSTNSLLSQMHRLPGRSWPAARTHASRIGIAMTEARAWSEEEREILRQIWRGKESIKVGMKRLPGRTYIAAKGEAQRLGLCGKRKRPGRTGYSWVDTAICRVLDANDAMSIGELAKETGASIAAIGKILRSARGKRFHVGGWSRASSVGDWTMKWSLGGGPDAPKPRPKSSRQTCRDWRERKRIRNGEVNPFSTVIAQVIGAECTA
jgi:hypothetical protein